jgi:hypothetical protein
MLPELFSLVELVRSTIVRRYTTIRYGVHEIVEQ